MIEYFEFQKILQQIIDASDIESAKSIAKKSLMDIESKIKDYENHLENIYRNEQDSEISL